MPSSDAPSATSAPRGGLDADGVVETAMQLVARAGLGRLTLRDLAQAIGRSTTVIVNLFGSKAGLIDAIAEAALERDRDFHERFFREIADLPPSRDVLAAQFLRYLRLRAEAAADHVRVWEEYLLHDAGESETRSSRVERWETMRLGAWTAYLRQDQRLTDFAVIALAYLTVEQFYAGALLGRGDYEALLVEGLGGLAGHALGEPDGPAAASDWFIQRLALPRAPAETLKPGGMPLRLLDLAADQLLAGGIGSVTNRSVSQAAGTSTSTILHHWPDMRRFVIEAIWHSVFRGMPQHLDHRRPSSPQAPADLGGWAALMQPTLALPHDGASGFYVSYARLIAQICLEARRDAEFRELAMLLRGPEGGGTYTNRANVWPPDCNLTRLAATRFAMWIKGRALTDAAVRRPTSAAQMIDAARQLVETGPH